MQKEEGPDPALDQIAASYDDLPYTSKAFATTHPARIGAIAQLLGLRSAPAETARVLELGCASGGNIIPQAYHNPEGRFLGVDLGARQIAEGQAKIAGLGLTNIELRCQSLTELSEDDGPFDYIIAHGVYSWVPEEVSDALLRICRALLAPGGVIFISYNVLPGWRMLQPARDVFFALIPADQPPIARVAQARSLLETIDCNPDDQGLYANAIRAARQRIEGLTDDLLFHEFMEDSNRPVTFDDFDDCAAGHSLAYLGDAEFSTMFPQNFPQPYAQALSAHAGANVLKAEQLNDVLSGRTFRQSLLIGSENQPEVVRQISPEQLAGLYLSGSGSLRLDRGEGSISIVDAASREMRSTNAAVGEAAERLFAALPNATAFDDLIEGTTGDDRAAIHDALLKLVTSGMLVAATSPMASGKLTDQPLASRLVRWDCDAGLPTTANPRHEFIEIDDISRLLVPLLDGTRDQDALVTALSEAISQAGLRITDSGAIVETVDQASQVVRKNLPAMLRRLELSGLLGQ